MTRAILVVAKDVEGPGLFGAPSSYDKRGPIIIFRAS
jgi:hypothetical protein